MENTRINEILGAKEFKKLVLKVEDIKFCLFDKIFPNYESNYEKRLKKLLDRKLLLANSEEEKLKLISDYQCKILLARKENVNKKNRNYHIRIDKPNEFITYLNKNKKIHVNGLIRNGIYYLIGIPLIIFGNGVLDIIGYSIISINTVATVINFECVNLQNYNIKRLTASKDKFERLYKKRLERELEKYSSISKVVINEFKNSKEVPQKDSIINGIKTEEEVKQMRELLLTELNKKNIENDLRIRRVLK